MSSDSSKRFSLNKNNLGSPAWLIISTIAIFIISQAIAVLAIGIFFGFLHSGQQPKFDESIVAQFFYVLIAEALAAWLAIKLVKIRGLGLSAIGLGRLPRLDDLIKAGIGFAAFYGLLIFAGIIINAFSPDLNNQKQDLGFTSLTNELDNILAFIALVLLPPIGEEILVRGYLFSGLRKLWRFWPVALVTSIIFGLAHLEFGAGKPLVWAAAIDTALLSIVLAFLRERTGALYAGMLLHVLNNLIAFFVVIK
jgi:membrane protease YdiL (CAAX protease family)